MDPPAPDLHALAEAALHLNAGKYFQLAGFVMLLYDHILTFSDEVERIWKQKITGASVLFLINRYVTPLQFIIIVDAFDDPVWTKPDLVGAFAFIQSISELITFLFILPAIPLPPGFVGARNCSHIGCILTGSSNLFPALWFAPLITDCCIFILTIWRTRYYLKRTHGTPMIQLFIRDGAIYFLAIFCINLLNTLIYFLAVEDLKAIGASFSQLLTATLISRLVLNIRSLSAPRSDTFVNSNHLNGETHTFMERAVGNLGNDMDSFLDHKSATGNHGRRRGRDEVALVDI
ncbi:hypothetical protein BDQ12DRAFT_635344, partial [Crucibulum laeve]